MYKELTYNVENNVISCFIRILEKRCKDKGCSELKTTQYDVTFSDNMI